MLQSTFMIWVMSCLDNVLLTHTFIVFVIKLTAACPKKEHGKPDLKCSHFQFVQTTLKSCGLKYTSQYLVLFVIYWEEKKEFYDNLYCRKTMLHLVKGREKTTIEFYGFMHCLFYYGYRTFATPGFIFFNKFFLSKHTIKINKRNTTLNESLYTVFLTTTVSISC